MKKDDEARLRSHIRDVMESAKEEMTADPFSEANYFNMLPEGVRQEVILTQVHTKKYDDGLELRIVSKTADPDDGIEVLVCERDPEFGWKDVACRRFPIGENHDLKYIVELFNVYEMLHGKDRRYLR
ncbi:MAG: hypothetical protein AABX47_05665 [Nanoarchaeota archaeon]